MLSPILVEILEAMRGLRFYNRLRESMFRIFFLKDKGSAARRRFERFRSCMYKEHVLKRQGKRLRGQADVQGSAVADPGPVVFLYFYGCRSRFRPYNYYGLIQDKIPNLKYLHKAEIISISQFAAY